MGTKMKDKVQGQGVGERLNKKTWRVAFHKSRENNSLTPASCSCGCKMKSLCKIPCTFSGRVEGMGGIEGGKGALFSLLSISFVTTFLFSSRSQAFVLNFQQSSQMSEKCWAIKDDYKVQTLGVISIQFHSTLGLCWAFRSLIGKLMVCIWDSLLCTFSLTLMDICFFDILHLLFAENFDSYCDEEII